MAKGMKVIRKIGRGVFYLGAMILVVVGAALDSPDEAMMIVYAGAGIGFLLLVVGGLVGKIWREEQDGDIYG